MKIPLMLFLLTFVLPVAAQTPPRPQSQAQPQQPSTRPSQPRAQTQPSTRSPQSQTQTQPSTRSPQSQAQPQLQTQGQSSAVFYVSDTLDLPLRAGASDRYKIIGAVQSGSPVEVLAVDAAKSYTQIRTPKGIKGWIPSNQITDIPSGRVQLAEVRHELEQLQGRHNELRQHMNDMVSMPAGGVVSYPQLYEEALGLRQQLAEYRKVAADTVAIDERNKTLQERTVTLERDLQIVQQENQAMRNENNSMKLLLGAVLTGTVLLVALLIPRILAHRREQWRRL